MVNAISFGKDMTTGNSAVLIEREIAKGGIEGVYFGPRVWVIARSPTAVLLWIFGQSQSINGFQRYYQPHLCILPDRTERFIYQPKYRSLRHEWTRLTAAQLRVFAPELSEVFGKGCLQWLQQAVQQRKTVIFEGGGGQLEPAGLYGAAFHEWRKMSGNGFIMVPEGKTRHELNRHKLGWKPEEAR